MYDIKVFTFDVLISRYCNTILYLISNKNFDIEYILTIIECTKSVEIEYRTRYRRVFFVFSIYDIVYDIADNTPTKIMASQIKPGRPHKKPGRPNKARKQYHKRYHKRYSIPIYSYAISYTISYTISDTIWHTIHEQKIWQAKKTWQTTKKTYTIS